MAPRKTRKPVKRSARKGGKSGSRSSALIVLIGAAAVAAILYAVMSPTGIFKPGPVASPAKAVSGQEAAKSSASSVPARVEPVKKAEPKAEPKPAPQPVPAAVAAVPPQPRCTGLPLSLSDIQGKVGNPAWVFIDVRPADRYAAAKIPGAVNIPAGDFEPAFARESAALSQASGIVIYGEDFNDPGVVDVCTKMAGKNLPRIYLFREGWSRWPQTP